LPMAGSFGELFKTVLNWYTQFEIY
jgi:hypothetical protein